MNYKKITKENLAKILKEHAEWLENNNKGNRADLSNTDLREHADIIRKANMSKANMSGANMSWADMSGADMSWADMSGANMSGADMSWADMSWANMSGANMSGANMSKADMSGADMSGANMSGADMSKKYISITRIGSRKGMTTYCFDDDIIWCGCFRGTLEEFEKQVKETHKDNPQFLKEYLGFIKYLKDIK